MIYTRSVNGLIVEVDISIKYTLYYLFYTRWRVCATLRSTLVLMASFKHAHHTFMVGRSGPRQQNTFYLMYANG